MNAGPPDEKLAVMVHMRATALQMALSGGHKDTAKTFLDAGAKVDASEEPGKFEECDATDEQQFCRTALQ